MTGGCCILQGTEALEGLSNVCLVSNSNRLWFFWICELSLENMINVL